MEATKHMRTASVTKPEPGTSIDLDFPILGGITVAAPFEGGGWEGVGDLFERWAVTASGDVIGYSCRVAAGRCGDPETEFLAEDLPGPPPWDWPLAPTPQWHPATLNTLADYREALGHKAVPRWPFPSAGTPTGALVGEVEYRRAQAAAAEAQQDDEHTDPVEVLPQPDGTLRHWTRALEIVAYPATAEDEGRVVVLDFAGAPMNFGGWAALAINTTGRRREAYERLCRATGGEHFGIFVVVGALDTLAANTHNLDTLAPLLDAPGRHVTALVRGLEWAWKIGHDPRGLDETALIALEECGGHSIPERARGEAVDSQGNHWTRADGSRVTQKSETCPACKRERRWREVTPPVAA